MYVCMYVCLYMYIYIYIYIYIQYTNILCIPQVETLVEAVVHPICAVKTAKTKVFGLGKAALKKTVTTPKVYAHVC